MIMHSMHRMIHIMDSVVHIDMTTIMHINVHIMHVIMHIMHIIHIMHIMDIMHMIMHMIYMCLCILCISLGVL